MSLVNRVIVTCRLENGDSLDASVKADGRAFNSSDVEKLAMKMNKLFNTHADDIIYYQVRTWSGDGGAVRKNWARIKTTEELETVIKEVMGCAVEETAS